MKRWPLLLLLLPACWSPPDHVVARWDLYALDGVPARPHSDRYTFWAYGGVDRRTPDGITRRGTVELEDDYTGRVTIQYGDEIENRVWIVVDCPALLPHMFGCRRIEDGGAHVELRAPGF